MRPAPNRTDLPSQRRNSGIAGAAARAAALSGDQRTEIAKKAASVRWNEARKEGHVVQNDKHEAERPTSRGAPEFSQYPDNSLCEPVREFSEVPSLLEVVVAHFAPKK